MQTVALISFLLTDPIKSLRNTDSLSGRIHFCIRKRIPRVAPGEKVARSTEQWKTGGQALSLDLFAKMRGHRQVATFFQHLI